MSSSNNNESSSSSSKIIKLKTSDNQVFKIEESILANQSKQLKHMAEDDCTGNVIPIPNVDGQTLAKIIEWCKKHRVDEPSDSEEEIKKWDDSFVDVDQATLLHLIIAANYLETEKLFDQLCDKAASMIKGRKVEEIREIFNIENDFTPEEEAEIRNENQWAFQ